MIHEPILLLLGCEGLDSVHEYVLFLDEGYAGGESAVAFHDVEHLVENHETCLCSKSFVIMKGLIAYLRRGVPMSYVIYGFGTSCESTRMFQK